MVIQIQFARNNTHGDFIKGSKVNLHKFPRLPLGSDHDLLQYSEMTSVVMQIDCQKADTARFYADSQKWQGQVSVISCEANSQQISCTLQCQNWVDANITCSPSVKEKHLERDW